MDLEKAYDMMGRHGMWQMLRVCGAEKKLLKAVQVFMKIVGRVSGLRREVNARVLGKGLALLTMNGGRFEINQL